MELLAHLFILEMVVMLLVIEPRHAHVHYCRTRQRHRRQPAPPLRRDHAPPQAHVEFTREIHLECEPYTAFLYGIAEIAEALPSLRRTFPVNDNNPKKNKQKNKRSFLFFFCEASKAPNVSAEKCLKSLISDLRSQSRKCVVFATATCANPS